MNIFLLTAEAKPYASTGGLGDVCGVLPQRLLDAKVNARLCIPQYKHAYDYIKNNGIEIKPVFKTTVFLGEHVESVIINESTHPNCEALKVYTVEHEFFNRDGIYGDENCDYHDNFNRFILFTKAALNLIEYLSISEEYEVDILHTHDWHTAVAPIYVKTTYADTKPFCNIACVHTIHNMLFQGVFDFLEYPRLNLPKEYLNSEAFEFFGKINFMKAGIAACDFVNTVSPTYAEELLTKEKGVLLDGFMNKHKEKFKGILNGANYSLFSPETDELITANFSKDNICGKDKCKASLIKRFSLEDNSRPLAVFVGRLDSQKGISFILNQTGMLVSLGYSVVILGSGNSSYEQITRSLMYQYRPFVGVETGFNEALAHEIYAGGDIFLMPSSFEPCGISQMYAMRYGTIPIVYKTGGLADTVKPYPNENATGFVFTNYSYRGFIEAAKEALNIYQNKDEFNNLRLRAMSAEFTWKKSVGEYIAIYKKASKNAEKPPTLLEEDSI